MFYSSALCAFLFLPTLLPTLLPGHRSARLESVGRGKTLLSVLFCLPASPSTPGDPSSLREAAKPRKGGN